MTRKTETRATATAGDARSTAAVARATAAHGRFFYSVRTIAVYCRASGAAPSARPENVQFHLTAADAECAGYNSNRSFDEKSNQFSGMTPSCYRRGGADTSVRFAIGRCSLGAILVATTERGVCAILMGEDPDALIRDLHDRFPRATLVGDDGDFEQLVAYVVGFVEAPRRSFDLPLDVHGTAYQQRVWQALRDIPPGKTASYSEIARRTGSPESARAVAQACAANALAVAIPCHRVVRTDGGLSGYRWGVERKRALLEREAKGGPEGARTRNQPRESH